MTAVTTAVEVVTSLGSVHRGEVTGEVGGEAEAEGSVKTLVLLVMVMTRALDFGERLNPTQPHTAPFSGSDLQPSALIVRPESLLNFSRCQVLSSSSILGVVESNYHVDKSLF